MYAPSCEFVWWPKLKHEPNGALKKQCSRMTKDDKRGGRRGGGDKGAGVSSLTKSSQVNCFFMQQPSLELNQNVISCTIEQQKQAVKAIVAASLPHFSFVETSSFNKSEYGVPTRLFDHFQRFKHAPWQEEISCTKFLCVHSMAIWVFKPRLWFLGSLTEVVDGVVQKKWIFYKMPIMLL